LNERFVEGVFSFDIYYLGEIYENVKLSMPGAHNAENASVAFAMAMEIGLDSERIINALGSFRGIRRRFERVVTTDDIIMIDDYAHHPTEIKAILSSIKKMYPEKKMTVVFQPHLFSRTQDFHEEFAQELSVSDELILTDIYPAREEPVEGVSSEMIYELVSSPFKMMTESSKVKDVLQDREVELLVILGAGDIDKEVNNIKEIYT